MSTQQSSQHTPNSTDEIIDLHALIVRYLRKWPWFVVSVFIWCTLGVFYILCKNQEYQVESTMMLRTNEAELGSIPGMDMLRSFGFGGSSRVVESELYVLNSQNLMRQVITDLDIQTRYRKKKQLRYIEQYPSSDIRMVYPATFTDTMHYHLRFTITKRRHDYKVHFRYGRKLRASYCINSLSDSVCTPVGTFKFIECKPLEQGDKMKINIQSMMQTIEWYRENLQASQISKESDVLSISTISSTPRKAIDMINKLIEFYNQESMTDKNIMAANTDQFIDERLKLITEELATIEQDVEQYKTDNKLTDIASEVQLFLATSSEYQKRVAELETQYNLMGYIEDYIDAPENQHGLIPANLGIRNEALIKLIEEYNLSLLERMKLLRTTNERNPVIQQLDSQIDVVRKNILSSIHSLKEGINITRRDVTARDDVFTERIQSVPKQEREYIEIKRQQKIKEALYIFLYQKREENALSLVTNIQPTKIIDKADVLPNPVAPRKKVVLAICLLFGLCFPVGLIFLLDLLHNRIESIRVFQQKVKIPVVGKIYKSVNKITSNTLIDNDKHVVESFRFLRTNLDFLLPKNESQVLLVTSCIPKEGKTFVATNLALAYAKINKRVCLVDFNLRNPQIHHLASGVTSLDLNDVFASQSDTFTNIVQSTPWHENLDCICIKNGVYGVEDLLLSPKIEDLFAYLKAQYDIIIIDSAPLGIVSDTFALNQFASATLMVSRIQYTPKEYMDLINELQDKQQITQMLCVLNGVEERPTKHEYGSLL